MSTAHSPIFPNDVLNIPSNIASGDGSQVTAYTAPATYPAEINKMTAFQTTGTARTVDIYHKKGSDSVRIGRFTTSAVANTINNILTSTNIPGLDASDPVLRLGVGEQIILDPTGTEANALEVMTCGLTYEYKA